MDLLFLFMWLGVLAAVFLPLTPSAKLYIGVAELVVLILWLLAGGGVWSGLHVTVQRVH